MKLFHPLAISKTCACTPDLPPATGRATSLPARSYYRGREKGESARRTGASRRKCLIGASLSIAEGSLLPGNREGGSHKECKVAVRAASVEIKHQCDVIMHAHSRGVRTHASVFERFDTFATSSPFLNNTHFQRTALSLSLSSQAPNSGDAITLTCPPSDSTARLLYPHKMVK